MREAFFDVSGHKGSAFCALIKCKDHRNRKSGGLQSSHELGPAGRWEVKFPWVRDIIEFEKCSRSANCYKSVSDAQVKRARFRPGWICTSLKKWKIWLKCVKRIGYSEEKLYLLSAMVEMGLNKKKDKGRKWYKRNCLERRSAMAEIH